MQLLEICHICVLLGCFQNIDAWTLASVKKQILLLHTWIMDESCQTIKY